MDVTPPAVTQRLQRAGSTRSASGSSTAPAASLGPHRRRRIWSHRTERSSPRRSRRCPRPWPIARRPSAGICASPPRTASAGMHVAPVVDAFAKAHPGVTVTLDLSDHPGAHAGREQRRHRPHRHAAGAHEPDRDDAGPEPTHPLCQPGAISPMRPPISVAIGPGCGIDAWWCRENDEDVTLWRFGHASREPETVRIRPAMCSNDGAVVREWAVAGQGVAIRSEWNVAADLAAGRLKRVLASRELPAADVAAMLGTRFGRSARATGFLAMLRQSLAPPPWRRRTVR